MLGGLHTINLGERYETFGKPLAWVHMYGETEDAGLTCWRCGVSRPTLRKCWRRYQAAGVVGLTDRSANFCIVQS